MFCSQPNLRQPSQLMLQNTEIAQVSFTIEITFDVVTVESFTKHTLAEQNANNNFRV